MAAETSIQKFWSKVTNSQYIEKGMVELDGDARIIIKQSAKLYYTLPIKLFRPSRSITMIQMQNLMIIRPLLQDDLDLLSHIDPYRPF